MWPVDWKRYVWCVKKKTAEKAEVDMSNLQ